MSIGPVMRLAKPRIVKDGNEWCCYSNSRGVRSFGPTPEKAYFAWVRYWSLTTERR